jgi:hypothetical protein
MTSTILSAPALSARSLSESLDAPSLSWLDGIGGANAHHRSYGTHRTYASYEPHETRDLPDSEN